MIQKYLLFSVFKNFIKLKKGLISRDEEENLQTNSLHCFVHPLLYFNFNNLKYANSMSFISFQCILHNSEVPLSFPHRGRGSNFLRETILQKEGGPNFLGEPILQNG